MSEPTNHPTDAAPASLTKQTPAVIETATDAPATTPEPTPQPGPVLVTGYNWENWAFASIVVAILCVVAVLGSIPFTGDIDRLANQYFGASITVIYIGLGGLGFTALLQMVVFYMVHNRARLLFLLPAMMASTAAFAATVAGCAVEYYTLYPR